jgi:hypothetical protein
MSVDLEALLELLRTHAKMGVSHEVAGSWLAMDDVLDIIAALERAERVEKENHWLRELAEAQDSLIAAYRIGIGGSRKAGAAIDLFRKAQERLAALAATPEVTS